MKRKKAIGLLVALALSLVAAAASTGVWMYRGTPSWYRPPYSTPEQRKAVANSADQKLLDIYSWAASVQARVARQRHAAATTAQVDDPPIEPKVVSITEGEFNSILEAWQKLDKTRRSSAMAYISDCRVILQDDQLILAGESSELGTVISAAFEPSIDARGQLHLDLATISAGRLPMPQVLISKWMGQLKSALRQRLTSDQRNARLSDKFVANEAAAAAIASRLLLDSLNGRASDPMVCVPFDVADIRHQVPVHLSSIKIEQGTLTMKLEPLENADSSEVLSQIKRPYDQHATIP